MRRDYFTLEVRNVDWVERGDEPRKPLVAIDFDGPTGPLRERLTDDAGNRIDPDGIDVAYRFQTPADDEDASGVLAITDRITGDFLLELNASGGEVRRLVRAARTYGEEANDDDGRYRLRVRVDGEDAFTHDKQTFLVYDSDGGLLRQHSLIPSGVEL